MELFQPWHIIIVVGLALLFFGGKKLPELGKGLGEGLKGFKEGMKGVVDDTPAAASNTTATKAAENAHTVTPKVDEPAVKS